MGAGADHKKEEEKYHKVEEKKPEEIKKHGEGGSVMDKIHGDDDEKKHDREKKEKKKKHSEDGKDRLQVRRNDPQRARHQSFAASVTAFPFDPPDPSNYPALAAVPTLYCRLPAISELDTPSDTNPKLDNPISLIYRPLTSSSLPFSSLLDVKDPVSIWTTCLKDWVSAWMKVVGYRLGFGLGLGFDLGVRGGRDVDG
ncbi:uncharacterized protein A4U43_C01F32230 [Asparagus officinalis]|uniref:Uncharacterized protein n=1 Tax=Asparagus officinalis TaxID=4686 RepID=A0A5P1FVG5_ASPOF|nr:uncharacterized protein A4U43_C01F32230 [Asparagus officinalis]